MGSIKSVFLLLILINFYSFGQVSSLRVRDIPIVSDTIQLDSLSIYPESFQLFCNGEPVSKTDYLLNGATSQLIIKNRCGGAMKAEYRVFPYNLTQRYQKRDTTFIYEKLKGNQDIYMYSSASQIQDIFGGSNLNKSGSISRGISFGNNQDMGINSSLNLELSGDIGPNLKLIASLSDDNIPIQPDGNTNKLQEFDKVFIQIFNDRLKIIGGDFWLDKPYGYFMNYKKRAQGLSIGYDFRNTEKVGLTTQVSGAFSRGKFNRQVIQGVEGNQGPYRLTGAENEPYIIILGGTERVYIDGRLMERGQDFDYVINYNSAEIIFTARNLITKDIRIVVEFQYSDQNYARFLVQTANRYQFKKLDIWLNAYSEQDAKNQTIQQDLTNDQKRMLTAIGDTLSLARISSIDSIGYLDNQIMYKMVDTLGYDSVLVHSVDPLLAIYRASFMNVGKNRGNYVLKEYIATGKVYQWVEPIAGIPQGEYEPYRTIITPKKRQLVTAGAKYNITNYLTAETEWSYSNNDLNTFSKFDRRDDDGYAAKARINGKIPLSKDSTKRWLLDTKLDFEALHRNYTPIEQYRSVEFDRDWNTRNKGFVGNQIASTVGTNFINRRYGNFNAEGQQYLIGQDYSGYRAALNGKWMQKGFRAVWDGSYLEGKSVEKSQYLRHKVDLSQGIKWLRIGFKDDHERNTFTSSAMPFAKNSYQFYDYQFYIENGDSIKNKYRLFYQERYDWISDSFQLKNAAKAQSAGGELRLTEIKNQTLTIISSYRQLKILDETLIKQTPENSILGRIDYGLRLWKTAFTWNTFYEVGSGLEQKKEFMYVQVNTGQGIYTWIDYNGDGVKDLNEFEIAQYTDQAGYIRVFTPSSEYVKTYSNEFNQSLFWRPERIWASKKGVLKVLSRFSDQIRIRINRKTNYFDGINAFNPFATNVRDTNLISTAYDFRNSFYFNRTSSVVGADWTYQKNQTKTLLASGFDSRNTEYHELNVRWNITKKISIETKGQMGNKTAIADYTTGRNYGINYYTIKPVFSLQTSTAFRVSLNGRYEEKHNKQEFGGESAYIGEIGTNVKFNEAEKGSLQAEFKMISIKYNGIQSSALGFEMLESLKPGLNFTWSIGYQRLISKNLQLSIQYNGRKSKSNKMIHSAGMEVRAFF
ncbi:MAG: hypothetical protein M9916_05170 [Crocinitomicaceae bacterium]|nr:hypothetical protein [Crocinitomicaceae bacterium]